MKQIVLVAICLLLSINSIGQSGKYYSVGSTKNEVLKIQGEPDAINEYDVLGESVWHYGNSTIKFKNGKVVQYSNYSKNLLIRLNNEKSEPKNESNISKSKNDSKNSAKNPLFVSQEEIQETYESLPKLDDVTGLDKGSGKSASFPEEYREMATEYGLSPFTPPSKKELDKMLLEYKLKKYGKWAIIIAPILLLIILFVTRKNKDNTKANKQFGKGKLKDKYAQLIGSFNDFDINNSPKILLDNENEFEIEFLGQSTISKLWFSDAINEIKNNFWVRYSLQYKMDNIKNNGNELKDLPQLNEKFEWKFEFNLSQIEMSNLIRKEIKNLIKKYDV